MENQIPTTIYYERKLSIFIANWTKCSVKLTKFVEYNRIFFEYFPEFKFLNISSPLISSNARNKCEKVQKTEKLKYRLNLMKWIRKSDSAQRQAHT